MFSPIPDGKIAVPLSLDPAPMERASKLDRLADHELACGHHTRAEQLAWHAASLRGQA